MNAVTEYTFDQTHQIDPAFDALAVRDGRRACLSQSARELAAEIDRIDSNEDKLSVLMGLGALVAEVAALAAAEA